MCGVRPRRSGKACAESVPRLKVAFADSPGRWNSALRVLGSIVGIPRPMRPCARPGFDGRPELRPVGGGDAEPDRGAGGAEGLARGEDHRDHGVLALLTELIFERFGHIGHHTSSVRPTSSAPKLRRMLEAPLEQSLVLEDLAGHTQEALGGGSLSCLRTIRPPPSRDHEEDALSVPGGRGRTRPRPPAGQRRLQSRGGRRVRCLSA